MRIKLSPKVGWLLAMGAVSTAVVFSERASAASDEGSVPSASHAVALDAESAPVDVPAQAPEAAASHPQQDTPGDAVAALLTLFGFLGLIGGNLVRWSGDTSAKSNRSAFS
jgi:hypothetical protein